jgi:NAD(P)-dependent dehydrogenase (short-subunit alcohol dehydrogenase family)
MQMARVVLVTGGSRGIGAVTAQMLAERGFHVLINYREKRKRAELLAEQIVLNGGSAVPVQADITSTPDLNRLCRHIATDYGRLDVLVLNASGGLELGADDGYAMRINRDAQHSLAAALSELMPPESRIVFVTSHQAHFYGQRDVPEQYKPIAESKRAGEDALRSYAIKLRHRGVGLSVVSGDMVDDTIIVRLLERRDSDAVHDRRAHGPLPTIKEFATAIADEAEASTITARTVFIGGSDYLQTTTAP